mgnify:FL=1
MLKNKQYTHLTQQLPPLLFRMLPIIMLQALSEVN